MNVMINSFRGGTGKSTIISNLASYLASFGRKVLIIDADVLSPGIHAIFGLSYDNLDVTLTDYLKGTADEKEIVYDISENLNLPDESLFIIPGKSGESEIAELLLSKQTGENLVKLIPKLQKLHNPDYILIDTHPGINPEVLVTFNVTDILLNVVRPDNQDYQGLEVTNNIVKKIGLNTYIVLNKVPMKLMNPTLSRRLQKAYNLPVAGMLPFTEDLMLSQSRFVFSDKNPNHPYSQELQKIASRIFGIQPKAHLDLMHYLITEIENSKMLAGTCLPGVKPARCRQYLEDMLKAGFIQSQKGTYSVTGKGHQFLKKYKTIRRFVRDFRL